MPALGGFHVIFSMGIPGGKDQFSLIALNLFHHPCYNGLGLAGSQSPVNKIVLHIHHYQYFLHIHSCPRTLVRT